MQPTNTDNAISLSLPRPVAIYLAAVKAKDADMLALCFADDARVHDENSDYRGLDAIRAWKQETDASKYRYRPPAQPRKAEPATKFFSHCIRFFLQPTIIIQRHALRLADTFSVQLL
jgi:hypothetical protein